MNAFKKYFAVAILAMATLFGGFIASAQTTATTPNYSGMWWSGPAESGWGMTLAHHKNASGNQMFAAFFVYAPDGRPFWFTVSGGVFSQQDRLFVGDLYVTTGPSYRLETFDPKQVTVRKAGTMSVSFSDDTHALLSYSVDGVTVTKLVEKLNFWNPPYDSWPNDYSDMWWNAKESGWGFNLAQNNDMLFGVWYGYHEDGSPYWFVMSGGTWTTETSFTGTAYDTTGPSYTNPVFNTNNVVVRPIGQVTMLMKNRDSMTFTFTANCTSKTRDVERLKFIANETGGTMYKPSSLIAPFVIAAGIAGCGGGGGGGSSGPSTGPAAATVAITQVAPANGATNVSVDTKPTLTFQVSNGSYLSHTADFRCGGNPVTHTSSVTGNVITLTPSSPASLVGQTCQINWTVNGTPSGNPGAQITQAWSYATVNVPAKLLIAINSPTLNGNQSMMSIDIATGSVSSVGIPSGTSLGCEAGNLRSDGLVRIACGIGSSHWDYNPVTGATTRNTTLANLPLATWTPVVSSPSGTDFYGVGANQGGGQVLVRNGNAFTGAIDISSKSLQYVAKVLGDFPSGKLYTLNQNLLQVTNPATLPAHVDRIDIATLKVETTYTDTVPGIGLALYNGELYMALQRYSSGRDVVKFNATTFQKTGEGATTLPGSNVQAIYGMAVDANGVHLGVVGGVQTLSHDLKTVLRTTTNLGPNAVINLTAHAGKLYVVISGTNVDNNVVELDSATHAVLRRWTVTGSPGRLAVVGN